MKVFKNSILFILLLNITIISCNKQVHIPVKEGVVDISNHNFKEDGIVNLNGEWEFYFKHLLQPSDFFNAENLPKKEYINVPQSWTTQKKYLKYPEQGFATYRLNFKTNDTITAIRIENKRIFTAYKIWLNGKLIKEVGKISTIKEKYTPDLKLLFSDPIILQSVNELIIQVSNYSDWRAGIINPVRIGESNSFKSAKKTEFITIVAILSIIFIIGLYHFILFIYRQSEFSNLLFSALAFLFIIIGIVGNDTELKNFINPDFDTITRLFHLGVSIYPALITAFFYLLFKNEVDKRVLIITIVFSTLLLIFSLFFDIYLVRKYVTIKILFTSLISIYFIFYSLPKAILKKQQGAKWALLGISVLFIANINDILFSIDYLKTGYFAIYGFAGYIIFQSLNIAERFSYSFKRINKLTKNLRTQNNEYLLLNKQYKQQNKELKIAKEKAETADKLKTAFLANMSHEIRTPMNAIIGFSNLLNNVEYTDERRKQITSYIVHGSNTLLHLIDDIIDISKIEANQLEIHNKTCSANEIINNLIIIYKEKNSSENIKLNFCTNKKPDIVLFSDRVRLQQVFINLIDNALKFTEKGSVDVTYEFDNSKIQNSVIFSVKDTGIGLTKEQQQKIFTRFTKLESKGEKLYRGAGLGLTICKNIVTLLGGEIWVKSEINKGSIFQFSIPINKKSVS